MFTVTTDKKFQLPKSINKLTIPFDSPDKEDWRAMIDKRSYTSHASYPMFKSCVKFDATDYKPDLA